MKWNEKWNQMRNRLNGGMKWNEEWNQMRNEIKWERKCIEK